MCNYCLSEAWQTGLTSLAAPSAMCSGCLEGAYHCDVNSRGLKCYTFLLQLGCICNAVVSTVKIGPHAPTSGSPSFSAQFDQTKTHTHTHFNFYVFIAERHFRCLVYDTMPGGQFNRHIESHEARLTVEKQAMLWPKLQNVRPRS